MKSAERVFLTWFGLGKIPYAPGTFASLGAIPLCYFFIHLNDSSAIFSWGVAILFTALAIFLAAQDQKTSHHKDPSYIVIDEVAGMLFATIPFSKSTTIYSWIAAFAFFRIYDILKPFPANWFDKRSKDSPQPILRGVHIVMDDVVAGIYSLISLLILNQFFSKYIH